MRFSFTEAKKFQQEYFIFDRHCHQDGLIPPYKHTGLTSFGKEVVEKAYKLALLPNLQVISLGGRVRRESLSLVDAQIDPLVPESIGKAFMGALGLSLDQGLTDVNPSEITVKQSIARRSRVIIALVDSTKWDKVSYGTFVPTGQIHTIISDQNAPGNMVTEIEKRGIKVIQVPTYFKDNR